jgi:hypothetical protein
MNISVPGLRDSDGVVFKTIPAAKYPIRITGIEIKDTKPGGKFPGSQYINIEAKIQAGNEHADAKLFSALLLPHESMDATQQQRCIAKLKRLCVACGIEVDDNFDTGDLMGAECVFVVSEVPKKDSQTGEKVNQVDDYLKIG